MKKAFIESVMKVLGIPKIEPHKLAFKEVLDGRDLEKDVQELDLATLKALFRWSGKELRKRL